MPEKNKELWFIECRKIIRAGLPDEWRTLVVGPRNGGFASFQRATDWKREAEQLEKEKSGSTAFEIEYRITSSAFVNSLVKWTIECAGRGETWKPIGKVFTFRADAEEYLANLKFFKYYSISKNGCSYRIVKHYSRRLNPNNITVRDFFPNMTTWSLQKLYNEHLPALRSEALKLAFREELPKTYGEWLEAPARIVFNAERHLRQQAELENAKKKEPEKVYAIQYRIPEFSGKDGKWSFCAMLKAGKVRHYHYSSKQEAERQAAQFRENLKEFANPGIEYRVVSKPKKSHRKFLPEQ